MENTAEKMPEEEPSDKIKWMTEDRIATNEAGQAQGRKDMEAEKHMSDEKKMSSICQGLLDSKDSVLRTPIVQSRWSKICHSLRNIFCKKEACQYKDLKNSLLCLQKKLISDSSFLVPMTIEQYQKEGSLQAAFSDFAKNLNGAVDALHDQ